MSRRRRVLAAAGLALAAVALLGHARRADAKRRKPARHPVLLLLDQERKGLGDQTPLLYDSLLAVELDDIAASKEARSPGSSEALWRALRKGDFLAGAVLWKSRKDPKVADFLLSRLRRDDPELGSDAYAVVFVLGCIRAPQAPDAIWSVMARFAEDPFIQVDGARAIYKINRSPNALAVMQRMSENKVQRWGASGMPLSEYAAAALEDIGQEAPARKYKRRKRRQR
ncbi:MAG: hypothetical protein HY927_00670 [Elusimicrobia bacterium]|nr:hypothetical protein [Elusimicrobiota bacterium]